MRPDDGIQTVAFQTLHRQIEASLMFAEFVDGYDVGVLKTGSRFCLAEEPIKQIGALRGVDGHDLDGHQAIQKRILRPVDDSHPAFADDVDDVVLPDFLG